MQKILEASLVVVVVAVGGMLFRECRVRRAPMPVTAARPGADGENAGGPPSARGVTGLPTMRLNTPPKPMRRRSVVPPPDSSAP